MFPYEDSKTVSVCPSVCRSVCLSICPYPVKRNHHAQLRQYQSYISNWFINGMVFTSTTPWKLKNLIFFQKSLKFEFWLVTMSWNNLSFVNISPTLVIDTSMERSSRVLQHWSIKIWFKKFEIEFRLVFCLICFLFKFEIGFWLIFRLVPKRWNHSSGSQQAPIWRHRGSIVVSSRVDI